MKPVLKIVSILLIIGIIIGVVIYFNWDKKTTIDSGPIALAFPGEGKTSIDEVANKITPIKLETQGEFIIGHITKVLKYEEYLFIIDVRSESIYKFRNDGSFVKKIGKQGKGPGEYTHILQVSIVEDKIYVNSIYKIDVYDLNGEYLYSINSSNIVDITSLNSDLIVLQTITNPEMTSMTANFSILTKNRDIEVLNE